jgi:flagellin
MALSINNNMMAMTAANNLTTNYNQLSTSINRLSSGLRINSAADDAAGMAVRELMRSDITVLNQGIRNANDAVSMLQTMDGAAAVIDEKLIRMKELAEQAATGTYSSEQRDIMNDEFSAMRDEIGRIAEATDFNGIKMLNFSTETGSSAVSQVLGYSEANAALSADSRAISAFSFTSGSAVTVSLTTHDGTTSTASFTLNGADTIASFLTSVEDFVSAAGGTISATWTSGTGLVITDGTSGASSLDVGFSGGGMTAMPATVETAGADFSDGQVRIHFGTGASSAEDYYYLENQNMTTGANGLNLDNLSVTTQAAASSALAALDTAILNKDIGRAHFGAMINRLESTVSNLTIQSENIQAAESQISDVDVAFEMTNFMNNQIKAQAAVAMLSQANSMPQMAMSLLGG